MYILPDGKQINNPKEVTIDGVDYPKSIFYDTTLKESLGIVTVVPDNTSVDKRYYNYTQEVVDGVLVKTLVSIDLDRIKERMLRDLSGAFKAKAARPRVLTPLGFEVDGGRDDLINFEIGRDLGLPMLKDADGVTHTVTVADYDDVTLAIKQTGLALYNIKWTKEEEIKALATLDDIIAYENEPYTVDTLDENGEPVTEDRTKNNVIEW